MIVRKTMTETTVTTTFSMSLDALLEAHIPKEERDKPLCCWWINSSGERGLVDFVRMERAAVAYDEEGRERLEEDERENNAQ